MFDRKMKLPIIESPTYNIKLPSSGKEITFRPFLVKEHKILLTLVNSDLKELYPIIKRLIDACCYDGPNINTLPYFDTVFLFLNIRAKSIGEVVQAKIKCQCGEYVSTEYNLDDLRLVKKDDHTNKLSFSDGMGIILKYPNLESSISLIDNPDKDILLDCIESIYDGEDIYQISDLDGDELSELSEWIDNLPIRDYNKIEKFFSTTPVLVQDIDADCDKCGTHIHTEITSLYNFFF